MAGGLTVSIKKLLTEKHVGFESGTILVKIVWENAIELSYEPGLSIAFKSLIASSSDS